jgi:hypothetical protein
MLEEASLDTFDKAWKPPEFVHAIVIELAGPGLRIKAPLDVKVGDRVLVVFELGEEQQQNSKTITTKIIQDIGEVRRAEAVQDGSSIAVELIGLSDSDMNELIRATNTASMKATDEGQNNQDSASSEGSVLKAAPVQGA